jgi:predicted RNase H-like HicB family nuclease
MNKYEVIIYWSEEDQVFVAEVPELPGCLAHGATHEAALANAQDAIRLWIDTATEFGDPNSRPERTATDFRLVSGGTLQSSIPVTSRDAIPARRHAQVRHRRHPLLLRKRPALPPAVPLRPFYLRATRPPGKDRSHGHRPRRLDCPQERGGPAQGSGRYCRPGIARE